jgi:hypothetical protein
MGKGKGPVDYFGTWVKPGKMCMEVILFNPGLGGEKGTCTEGAKSCGADVALQDQDCGEGRAGRAESFAAFCEDEDSG